MAADTDLQQLDATHIGDGKSQHSVQLIAERIPALADADAVTYLGGYRGTLNAPRGADIGPSDLWLHAVVDLAPGAAQALLDQAGDAAVVPGRPDVVPQLADALPQGELWASPALDALHSTNGWHSTVYVSVAANQLVLIAGTM